MVSMVSLQKRSSPSTLLADCSHPPGPPAKPNEVVSLGKRRKHGASELSTTVGSEGCEVRRIRAPAEAQRLRSRWRLCCLTDAAYPLRVSGFGGKRRSKGAEGGMPTHGRPDGSGLCDDEGDVAQYLGMDAFFNLQ